MGRRGCERDLFVLSDSSSNSIAGRHRSLHTKSDVVLKRNASNAHVDGFAGKSPQLMKELWRKRNLIGLHNKRTIIKKCVGADAHIGPEADGMGVPVFSDRSGIAPYAEDARFFVGADAHLGSEADGIDVSVLLDRSGDIPHGAMRASPPTLKMHVVFCRGRCPHRPGSPRYRRVRFL